MWTHLPKQETKGTTFFSPPSSSRNLRTSSALPPPTTMRLQKTIDNRVITQFLNEQKQASSTFKNSQDTVQMKQKLQKDSKYLLSKTNSNNNNMEAIEAWKKQYSSNQIQNQTHTIQRMPNGNPEDNDSIEELNSIFERIEELRTDIRSFLEETNDFSHLNLLKYLDQLEESFCNLDEEDNDTMSLLLETLEDLEEEFTNLKKGGKTTSKKEEDIQLPTTFPNELKKEYKLSGNSRYFNSKMYQTINECTNNIKRAKGELLSNADDVGVWEEYNKIVEIVSECAKLETEEQIKTYWTMLRIGLVGEILDMKNKALQGAICNEDMANSILNTLKEVKK